MSAVTRLGSNLKLTIDAARRAEVRSLFVDVFGAAPSQPAGDLEVYRLAGGANVGVYFVDAGEALSELDQRKGAWLELAVDDAAAVAGKLRELGVAQIEYVDTAHDYFQIPGGPVFRLAGR